MKTIQTRLEGPILIQPRVFPDERGFFCETYRQQWHEELGIPEDESFIQDNHSRSSRGVVRGMHFQVGQGVAKLVRCGRGSILDVLVDLRAGSPSYGEWEAYHLDDVEMRLLYVPVGFAHGFCVLSQTADVIYKQSAYYDPALEKGISWCDPEVAIDWPSDLTLTASERDAGAPRLAEIADQLPFRYSARGRQREPE